MTLFPQELILQNYHLHPPCLSYRGMDPTPHLGFPRKVSK
jgi:hypothetical protein